SHDLKLGYGVTDWWRIIGFASAERPGSGDPHIVGAGVESILVLRQLNGDGVGLGLFSGIELATHSDATNIVELGPLVQVRKGAFSALLNPLIERTFGQNREPGAAFTYLWQAKYELNRGLSLGLEGFGRIPNLGAAPSLQLQDHRMGP